MIADSEYLHGSLCQQRGHDWQPTSQQGRYQCQVCEVEGVCPACLGIVPVGMLTVRCNRHRQGKRKEDTPDQRRTYQPPPPPDMLKDGSPAVSVLRTSRARQVTTEERYTEPPIARPRHRSRFFGWILRGMVRHWFALLVAVLLVLIMAWALQSWVLPTVTNLQDQWHTGDGRITQFDANVGHGGTSHFLAEFYKGQVLVIEFPGESAKDAHVYGFQVYEHIAMTNPIITLSVRYMNFDGRPDLLIQIEGDEIGHILYNNGTTFQATPPTN